MDTKDSNPKDAIGCTKTPMSTLSAQVMGEVGVAMLEGALKYGRHNYRAVGVRASVYYDALFRHMGAWFEGEDIDPASGLSHVTKAIAGLMVLRDSMMQGNWTDDRPPKAADPEWMEKLNAQVAALLKKYPEPKAAFTEKAPEPVQKVQVVHNEGYTDSGQALQNYININCTKTKKSY